MYRLYDYLESGNGYKVRLLLHQLGEPFERLELDIVLYAYTHVAAEGGFDLTPFTAIGRWLERVRKLPHHIPITQSEGLSRDSARERRD